LAGGATDAQTPTAGLSPFDRTVANPNFAVNLPAAVGTGISGTSNRFNSWKICTANEIRPTSASSNLPVTSHLQPKENPGIDSHPVSGATRSPVFVPPRLRQISARFLLRYFAAVNSSRNFRME
jgi:hypothetical protein